MPIEGGGLLLGICPGDGVLETCYSSVGASDLEMDGVDHLTLLIEQGKHEFPDAERPRESLPAPLQDMVIERPSQSLFVRLGDEEDPLKLRGNVRIDGHHRSRREDRRFGH